MSLRDAKLNLYHIARAKRVYRNRAKRGYIAFCEAKYIVRAKRVYRQKLYNNDFIKDEISDINSCGIYDISSMRYITCVIRYVPAGREYHIVRAKRVYRNRAKARLYRILRSKIYRTSKASISHEQSEYIAKSFTIMISSKMKSAI